MARPPDAKLPTEVQAGQYHNDMLGMASDTVLRLTTLPRLLLTMLETEGWRRLVRPIDHRVFENATIEEWVLGEPWPGLHFPDWATVYALLAKNIEVGSQCIARLQEAGAPSPEQAERIFRVRAAKEGPSLQRSGRPIKGVGPTPLPKGESSARLAARLNRDHPAVFAALERGEYRSVHAAARAAGLVPDPDPVKQCQRYWTRLTPDQRQAFLQWATEQERGCHGNQSQPRLLR